MIHQLAFCLITMFGMACGAFAVTRNAPARLGAGLVGTVCCDCFDHAPEHARRVSFARLRLMTAFLFDTLSRWDKSAACSFSPLRLAIRKPRVLGDWISLWDCRCGLAVVGQECYHPRLNEPLRRLQEKLALREMGFG